MSVGSRAAQSDTAELEEALARASQRALACEAQIKALESKLSTSLSNSRALSALLDASSNSLAASNRRAERALNQHVPATATALRHSGDALNHLREELPEIRSQVAQVRRCYDSGRTKARELIAHLEFMNLPVLTRSLVVVFGPSPASARRTLMLRLFFGGLLLIAAWTLWATVRGLLVSRHAHA